VSADGGAGPGAGGGESSPGDGASNNGNDAASLGSGVQPTLDPSGMGHYVQHIVKGHESGGAMQDSTHPDPPTQSKSADDFSLDGTGLPRYDNHSRVMSAVAMRTDITGDSATSAAIQTSDSFDKVASWYHDKLPADWKEVRSDVMQKMSKQLSMANIGKTLQSYANGVASDADTAAAVDTSAPPPGPVVAIWSAPDNTTQHQRSVAVTTKPGQPTMIVLTRSVKP
jgi:hypothetical protein